MYNKGNIYALEYLTKKEFLLIYKNDIYSNYNI